MMALGKEFISDFYSSGLGKNLVKSEVTMLLHETYKGEKILDIGSGIGTIEKYLTGIDITGLESSDELLLLSRRSVKSLFVKGRAEDLPFLKETFDVALLAPLPDPIKDYGKALGEASAVLKNGGRMIVPTLNRDSAYFSALLRYGSEYAGMARSVGLGYIEGVVPKSMKLANVKRVGILHAHDEHEAPDMYVPIYSKL